MKCLLNKFSVSLLCVHLISQLALAKNVEKRQREKIAKMWKRLVKCSHLTQ